MKIAFYISFVFAVFFVVSGCASDNSFEVAGIEPLNLPKEIGENPLGTTSLKLGMTKKQVESLWGKPDLINVLAASGDASGSIKEEWIYKAEKYSPVAIDVEYMSKTKHLTFDGNNLIKVESEK